MSSRKPSRDAEPDMAVKTADGQPLPAESLVLRTFSSCAKHLPASAAEWDVSGFLYNGQPFTHETVKCWVSCAYAAVHGPAELDAGDKEQLSTAKGLHAVLSFAHAVGSPAAVCAAACSQLGSLKIVAQLPEQTLEFELSCQGAYYFAVAEEDSRQLKIDVPRSSVGQPVSSQQEQDVIQQVAEQTGALLHLAHVLRLQPLITALHDFIFYNATYTNSVLFGVLALVFSDATVFAALGSSTVSKEAYITSALSRPCGFVAGVIGHVPLFKPVGKFELHDEDTGVLQFEARVLREFAGLVAGERVEIGVDLFNTTDSGPAISLRGETMSDPVYFPAQLLLGYAVTDCDDAPLLMRSKLPQQP